MQRLGSTLLAVAFTGSVALLACQKTDDTLAKKLDEISAKLDSIDKKMGQGGGAGMAGMGRAGAPQRPAGPSPEDIFAVGIDGYPSDGPANAKVTIVKAFEFACPFCERVRPTLDQLRKDYPNDVKIVYRSFVVHPQVATDPALAACAANKQGKFLAMQELLWEKGFKNNRNYSRDNIDSMAKEAGLDLARFKADMDGVCKQLIQKDQQELSAVGVRGTPAFYINGHYLSGAQPIDRFKTVIDAELKKANAAIAKGEATPETYYSQMVLKKGKKSL
jgi:protein-disulfide isomerase